VTRARAKSASDRPATPAAPHGARRGHDHRLALRRAAGRAGVVLGHGHQLRGSDVAETTLLSIIGGLDRPTSGRVEVAGQDVTRLGADGLARMLRETVAFIFQSFGLLPVLSAAENVGIPMRLARLDPATRERRARALLGLVGLTGHADQRPYELSGGEQQRVAIARALANSPELLLADEPTGQLDSDTAGQIMRLLRSIVHDESITAIVATHDPVLIGLADRVLNLRDGLLVP